MIKKSLLSCILIAVFVVTSLGSAMATKDIAYISKDSGHVDASIVSLLDQKNYSYDIIYPTALSSTNFSNYKIILVGEGIYSNYTQIPVNVKNSVILNTYYLDEWGWSGSGVSTLSSNVPPKSYVYDNTSAMTKGVSGYFNPYTSTNDVISYDLKYIPNSQYAPGLSTVVADDVSLLKLLGIYVPSNGAVVAMINNGSILKNNQISKARGVFLGFPQTQLWTDSTKKIFYNSLNWAIAGEDKDGDGFFTDTDCNDSNSSINPNATEIPYNHVDENCDGYDLADVDHDGYCKAGYVIENKALQCPNETGNVGTDCNDNDPTYNIGSTDLTKNCVNDAPIIESIPKIYVHETENVSLYVNATDPENDNMTYSINDSRFVHDSKDKTHFTWQTNYTDAGDYNFFVRVSDGQLYSEKKFSVKVWNTNKAPDLLMNIPPQVWDEDTNHTLNLTQYFNDIDGDNLTYLFISTSDDQNINLIKLTNGVAYFDSAKDWNGKDWIIFGAADGIHVTDTNNITLEVLPVNDPPVLLKEIGNITTNEDTVYNLNLSQYFHDVDSVLSYVFQDTPHTTLELNGDILSITPKENWHGKEDTYITASDGEYEVTDNFTINVNFVNKPPIVQPIADQFILAGQNVSINANATDVEGDPITFSINDSRFVQNGNNFEWQTGEKDFGVYNFKVAAFDGMNYGYANAKVDILQKIFINELAWGNEGWIELYNPQNTSFSLSNCAITNGDEDLTLYGNLGSKGYSVFGWNALKNQGAIELNCNGVLIDSVEYEEFNLLNSFGRKTDGASDFVVFDYPTKGASNSADVTKPEVKLDSPANNTLFSETRDVTFNFTASDNMAQTLSCGLIANSKSLATGDFENNTRGSFFIDYLPDGIYTWNVECSDGTNKNTAKDFLMINISAPDAPVLSYIPNQVVNENSQLRFPIFATDQDNDPITLTASGLPDGANFTDNKVGNGIFVWIPNYNQAGTYNVKFTATDSTGLSDSHTITILVGETKEPPKFSDADTCASKNGSIEITMKNPHSGDDFNIGDTINGTVRIKNKFADSRDFDVHVYLYDLKDEQAVGEYDDTISLDNLESGDIDFSIDIPSDTTNKDFAIYAYVEGDTNECNSNYVNININRQKHDVIVGDITTDQNVVSPGSDLGVNVKTENLGREDEEVSVLVEIPALNISQRSDQFKIEKYGNKNKNTETLSLTIPESAREGTYEIKASVIFTDGTNSKLQEFEVSNSGTGTVTAQNSTTINLNSGSNSGGTTLILGNPSTGSSGHALVLGNPAKTSAPKKSLFKINTLNLGVKEIPQKEDMPNVKVEFNGDTTNATSTSTWVLLAVILGLLIIVIFILIVILR
jgi:hypothetical protein